MVDHYAAFESKWNQWLVWLHGADPIKGERISLFSQVASLAHDSFAFRALSEGHTSVNEDGDREISPMIVDTICRWFVISHSVRIRKLVERNSTDRNRGVISLHRLLSEMQESNHLITRGNVLRFEEAQPLNHETRQRQFDRYANKTEEDRSMDDHPNESLFETVIDSLRTSGKVKRYVDKEIAHAADAISRESVGTEDLILKYYELWKAEEDVFRAFGFLYCLLKGSSSVFGPEPAGDHFEWLDRPLVPSTAVPLFIKRWREFQQEFLDVCQYQ